MRSNFDFANSFLCLLSLLRYSHSVLWYTSAFYIVDATILRYIMYYVFEAHDVLVIMAPVSTRDVPLLESYILTR